MDFLFGGAETWFAAAKLLQSCLTLCDPIDSSPPRPRRPWDSPGKNTGVGCHFLLQCRKVKCESESEVAQLCLTLSDPMDCSYQAPLSMGFSRQEYWSGVPLPSPRDMVWGNANPIWKSGSKTMNVCLVLVTLWLCYFTCFKNSHIVRWVLFPFYS